MKRVTGIGGIFFKSQHPEKLKEWYGKHLGITPKAGGYVSFEWHEMENPDEVGSTAWALFPQDTGYFAPSMSSFMINYRVEDLDGLLAELRKEGVEVKEHVEEYEYGRFGWILDPEGNRIELWEPPKKKDL